MNKMTDNETIVSKVLINAKSSKDLLDSNEEDLFEIFQSVSHPAKHTATGKDCIGILDHVSIQLSLDFERASKYFEKGSPYISRALHLE